MAQYAPTPSEEWMVEGGLVLATIPPYPPWPAIILDDPETNMWYKYGDKNQLEVYILYLEWWDQNFITDSWIKASNLQQYKDSGNEVVKRALKRDIDDLRKAVSFANQLKELSVGDRKEAVENKYEKPPNSSMCFNGALVMASVPFYPPWPSIVSEDPITGKWWKYMEGDEEKYEVYIIYLEWFHKGKITFGWIKPSRLKEYQGTETVDVKKVRKKDEDKLRIALSYIKTLLRHPAKVRLNKTNLKYGLSPEMESQFKETRQSAQTTRKKRKSKKERPKSKKRRLFKELQQQTHQLLSEQQQSHKEQLEQQQKQREKEEYEEQQEELHQEEQEAHQEQQLPQREQQEEDRLMQEPQQEQQEEEKQVILQKLGQEMEEQQECQQEQQQTHQKLEEEEKQLLLKPKVKDQEQIYQLVHQNLSASLDKTDEKFVMKDNKELEEKMEQFESSIGEIPNIDGNIAVRDTNDREEKSPSIRETIEELKVDINFMKIVVNKSSVNEVLGVIDIEHIDGEGDIEFLCRKAEMKEDYSSPQKLHESEESGTNTMTVDSDEYCQNVSEDENEFQSKSITANRSSDNEALGAMDLVHIDEDSVHIDGESDMELVFKEGEMKGDTECSRELDGTEECGTHTMIEDNAKYFQNVNHENQLQCNSKMQSDLIDEKYSCLSEIEQYNLLQPYDETSDSDDSDIFHYKEIVTTENSVEECTGVTNMDHIIEEGDMELNPKNMEIEEDPNSLHKLNEMQNNCTRHTLLEDNGEYFQDVSDDEKKLQSKKWSELIDEKYKRFREIEQYNQLQPRDDSSDTDDSDVFNYQEIVATKSSVEEYTGIMDMDQRVNESDREFIPNSREIEEESNSPQELNGTEKMYSKNMILENNGEYFQGISDHEKKFQSKQWSELIDGKYTCLSEIEQYNQSQPHGDTSDSEGSDGFNYKEIVATKSSTEECTQVMDMNHRAVECDMVFNPNNVVIEGVFETPQNLDGIDKSCLKNSMLEDNEEYFQDVNDNEKSVKSQKQSELMHENYKHLSEIEQYNQSQSHYDTSDTDDSEIYNYKEIVAVKSYVQGNNIAARKSCVEGNNIVARKSRVEDTETVVRKTHVQGNNIVARKSRAEDVESLARKYCGENPEIVARKSSAEIVAKKSSVVNAQVVARKSSVENAEIVARKSRVKDAEIVARKSCTENAEIVARKSHIEDAEIVARKSYVDDKAVVARKSHVEDMGIVARKSCIQNEGILARKSFIEDEEIIARKSLIEDEEIVARKTRIEDIYGFVDIYHIGAELEIPHQEVDTYEYGQGVCLKGMLKNKNKKLPELIPHRYDRCESEVTHLENQPQPLNDIWDSEGSDVCEGIQDQISNMNTIQNATQTVFPTQQLKDDEFEEDGEFEVLHDTSDSDDSVIDGNFKKRPTKKVLFNIASSSDSEDDQETSPYMSLPQQPRWTSPPPCHGSSASGSTRKRAAARAAEGKIKIFCQFDKETDELGRFNYFSHRKNKFKD